MTKALALILTLCFGVASIAQVSGPPVQYKTVSIKTIDGFFSQSTSSDAKKVRLLAKLLTSVFRQETVSVAESTPLDKMGSFLEFKLTDSGLLYQTDSSHALTVVTLDDGQRRSLREILPEISRYAKGETPHFVFRHLQAWAMLEVGDAKEVAAAKVAYRSFMESILENDGPARIGLPPNMVNFAMLGDSLPADEKNRYLARVEARLAKQRELLKEQDKNRSPKRQSP